MHCLLPVTRAALLAACTLSLTPAATISIVATDARNVSDYHEEPDNGGFVIITDGDGDQVATDPYPLLGAGIHLSGASGQNGTARFQMEFSLGSLSGFVVTNAMLILHSEFAPNQTLDTFFYHVTTDEEGNITANDFQSAAVDTGIVQSPVMANAVHSYDVTTFVQQDLLAGFAFTSFQGRVDETASMSFARGVEFYSLAAMNDPALYPRLEVTYQPIPEPATTLLVCSGLAFVLAASRRFRQS